MSQNLNMEMNKKFSLTDFLVLDNNKMTSEFDIGCHFCCNYYSGNYFVTISISAIP